MHAQRKTMSFTENPQMISKQRGELREYYCRFASYPERNLTFETQNRNSKLYYFEYTHCFALGMHVRVNIFV